MEICFNYLTMIPKKSSPKTMTFFFALPTMLWMVGMFNSQSSDFPRTLCGLDHELGGPLLVINGVVTPYKWPWSWVTGVISLLIGAPCPSIYNDRRGPPCSKGGESHYCVASFGIHLFSHPQGFCKRMMGVEVLDCCGWRCSIVYD